MGLNLNNKLPYFYTLGKKGNNPWWVWVAAACVFITVISYLPGKLNYLVLLFFEFFSNNSGQNILLGMGKKGPVEELVFQAYLYIPYIIFLALGLIFVQKHMRQRPLKDIITSANKFRWAVLWKAVMVYLFVLACAWFIKSFFAKPGDVTWVFDKNMLMVWPIIIICLPLYVLVQEMLYRAFIVQGLAMFIKNSLVVYSISSSLYALSFIYAYDMIFGWQAYLAGLFVYGIFACIISSMSGGIEAAVGIGVVSGLLYSLFISSHMQFFDQAFSLYSTGEPHYDAGSFFIELAILTLTAILLSYLLPTKEA